MRIDKVNLDLYVAVPDEVLGPDFTAENSGRAMLDALVITLGPVFSGAAVNTAASLTEDEWLAEQARLAQGCGHCEGCKARAAQEAEWAEANGFVV
jgi:hypothetical protein